MVSNTKFLKSVNKLSLEVVDIIAALILFSSGLQFLQRRFHFVVVVACVKFPPWTGRMLVPAAVDIGVHLLLLSHQLCAS